MIITFAFKCDFIVRIVWIWDTCAAQPSALSLQPPSISQALYEKHFHSIIYDENIKMSQPPAAAVACKKELHGVESLNLKISCSTFPVLIFFLDYMERY